MSGKGSRRRSLQVPTNKYGESYDRIFNKSKAKSGQNEPLVRDVLLADKYNELLYAVESKYADETRHETALRYIKDAETIKSHDFTANTCSK